MQILSKRGQFLKGPPPSPSPSTTVSHLRILHHQALSPMQISTYTLRRLHRKYCTPYIPSYVERRHDNRMSTNLLGYLQMLC